jgi:phosphopantothenoylcysteine decarboxylase / phosphopantothenate---cysteine ligase
MTLSGKHILVGVTGSIAAYKSALLVRELVKAGAEVRVVMTPAACEFITPLTLATLSQGDVALEMFPADRSKGTWHIHLALWADVMIVAPASANTIAKLAHGFADNALTSLALALRCPLIIAPAMDTDMYVHTATQQNLDLLRQRGIDIIAPDEGELASGLSGPGRLPDIHVLLQAIERRLAVNADLQGKTVLVTAGPTFEAIDPVRFIGNRSSGKMGFAVAEAAARRGARVILVSGPVHLPTPSSVQRIDVESATAMYDVVMEKAHEADICVLAAAVSDFAPSEVADEKIKKTADSSGELTLRLERTPDILKTLGEQGGRALVGFALETEKERENALRKLREKKADLIVLNNPRVEGAAFGGDSNVATIFSKRGEELALPKMSKAALADVILDSAVAVLASRNE